VRCAFGGVEALKRESLAAGGLERRVDAETAEYVVSVRTKLDDPVRARGERFSLAQSSVNGHPDRAGEVAVTRARRNVGVGGSSGGGLHATGDAVEQRGQELEAGVGELVRHLPARAAGADQPGLPQPAQMVRQLGQRYVQLRGQPADGGRAGVTQAVDHAQTDRIRNELQQRDPRVVGASRRRLVVLISSLGIAAFQVRVSRGITEPRRAALGALASGVALALACLLFASTAGLGGWAAIVIVLVAAGLHVTGELLFVASSWGLSVPLMPKDAPSEYQGAFATGEAVALMLAPALMTTLVAGWGQPGWLVLAAIFLIPALAVASATGWALRTREAALTTS